MSKSSDDKSRRRPTARKTTAGKISAAKKGKKSPVRPEHASALLGVGLDSKDGHKRITTGEQFAIVGGSEETHDRMTETVIKTFEELKHRGKHLSQVERAELSEILHKATPK